MGKKIYQREYDLLQEKMLDPHLKCPLKFEDFGMKNVGSDTEQLQTFCDLDQETAEKFCRWLNKILQDLFEPLWQKLPYSPRKPTEGYLFSDIKSEGDRFKVCILLKEIHDAQPTFKEVEIDQDRRSYLVMR